MSQWDILESIIEAKVDQASNGRNVAECWQAIKEGVRAYEAQALAQERREFAERFYKELYQLHVDVMGEPPHGMVRVREVAFVMRLLLATYESKEK